MWRTCVGCVPADADRRGFFFLVGTGMLDSGLVDFAVGIGAGSMTAAA